jgi:uncharacterized protein YndB with AHSA1/START domain
MPAQPTTTVSFPSDREIRISRTFAAPRELIWAVWTDPKHVAQWWGPRGFSTTIEKMDVRPGGAWRHVMRGPDGTLYPNKSKFIEVVKPERIVMEHGGRKKGGPAVQFRATWTFAQRGRQTVVTLHSVFPTAAKRDKVIKIYGAVEGGKQTLARLGEYLATVGQGQPAADYGAEKVGFTRVFDAPRELVWRAWIDPKRMAKWWGPHGFTNPVCIMDARAGGALCIVMRGPDGAEYPMTGVFREVTPTTTLIFSMVALDGECRPLLEGQTTATFVQQGGKTKLVVEAQAIGLVPVARQMLGGMKAGWKQSLERLEELMSGR